MSSVCQEIVYAFKNPLELCWNAYIHTALPLGNCSQAFSEGCSFLPEEQGICTNTLGCTLLRIFSNGNLKSMQFQKMFVLNRLTMLKHCDKILFKKKVLVQFMLSIFHNERLGFMCSPKWPSCKKKKKTVYTLNIFLLLTVLWKQRFV